MSGPPQGLKRDSVTRFFASDFFPWIRFPQASDYTIRAVSNFFENSRRYSQLKVHHRCRWHRWQMAKMFKQIIFIYFVWTPLSSRVNMYITFCFKFNLRCLQPDIVPIICHRCRWHRWQICRWCRWYQWRKNSNTLKLGGNWFKKKTRNKKSCDTVPLKGQ